MSTSFKVPVTLLLGNAEAELARLRAEGKKPTLDYEAKLERWRIRANTVLSDFVDDLYHASNDETSDKPYQKLMNKINPSNGSNGVVVLSVKVPRPPEKPYRYGHDNKYDIERVEADIKLLKATSSTDVSVRSGSNLARYL